jgi:predicted Zn-dependent peptidase
MSEISNIFQGQKQKEDEKKKQRIAQALEAAKKRKDEEDQAALEEEKKKKLRYGSSNVPMTEYLGANQAGVRKTLLGG